jgi:hypothetical protein
METGAGPCPTDIAVRWHRAGFKLYWTWLSRHRSRMGRKCVRRELREPIFRMVTENPTWGAPRIHGELKMLSLMHQLESRYYTSNRAI